MTENRDAELVVSGMRAGLREILWKPFPAEELADKLGAIARDLPAAARRLGRLIPVSGACGGVGASTLAVNLAVELANLEAADGSVGARPHVAIVDLDFRFGHVAMYLDAQPQYTIAELCDGHEMIESQMIQRVMTKHASGVHVLAHPHDFEQAAAVTAARCSGALSALLEHYDYVVCDGPMRFDPTGRSVLDMADEYLLVVQLVVPAVRNADRLLQEMRRNGCNMDRLRLVCNRCTRDAGFLDQTDVEATLGRKFDFTLPDDWKTASTSVNVGVPLIEYAPKSKLRMTVRQIAQRLAGGQIEDQNAGDAKSKGLMKLFAG
jgi:pilus assembly protein CpaE